MLSIVGPRKVRVSKEGVAAFNARWPCSTLRDSRAYWFEFAANGELVDVDIPEQDDGPAASAMADDCREWFFNERWPEWAPEDAPTPIAETAAEQGARLALEAFEYLDSDLTPEQRAALASLREWANGIIRE